MTNEYDVLLITETWLKSYHKSSELCANSMYSMIRSDRHDKHHGGGVGAFVKQDLCKQVNIIATTSEAKEFDIIAFDLHLKRNNIIRLVCVYLPPDSSRNNDIVIKLVNILNQNFVPNYTYIFGDFNFSKAVWKNGNTIYSPHNNMFDYFYNFLLTKNLVQLIDESTHKSGNTLDLVMAPRVNEITKISLYEPFCSTCDHNTIHVLFTKHWKQTSFNNQRKNFYKGDYCAINSFLRGID